MAITYKWEIAALDVEDIGAKVDVVTAVHWRREGAGLAEYGVVSIPAPTDGTFIPYDQLKEDDIVDWVQAALGLERVTQIESNIAGVAEAIQNPKVRHETEKLESTPK